MEPADGDRGASSPDYGAEEGSGGVGHRLAEDDGPGATISSDREITDWQTIKSCEAVQSVFTAYMSGGGNVNLSDHRVLDKATQACRLRSLRRLPDDEVLDLWSGLKEAHADDAL